MNNQSDNTSNAPTPNQDELQSILAIVFVAGSQAGKGSLWPQELEKKVAEAKEEALTALRSYLERTVAERLLAIIGEDEPASTVDQEEQWLIDARNGLRAELRTAAQQQKGTEK